MSVTLIKNAGIVSEDGIGTGSVLIVGDTIRKIHFGDYTPGTGPVPDTTVDASGCLLFPGIIDDHVHFREPGLTHKATIASESLAAVAGGITTVFDMPNCLPQTTTLKALDEKFEIASRDCLTNYSFYIGATRDNLDQIEKIDPRQTCGIKLFMGSSTGDMLVDDSAHIRALFKAAPALIAAHCEESSIINRNMAAYTEKYGGEPPVQCHPLIRSVEACYESSAKAVEFAVAESAKLHILHISTARELSLFTKGSVTEKKITCEAVPAHLIFTDSDYGTLGTRIKCNPAVKSPADRDALRHAVADGKIDVIGTDHAPHLLSEKTGGCRSAASGMPVLPYSLTAMMELVEEGVLTTGDIVRTMCHNPALLFGISLRGFVREGYKADITLISRNAPGEGTVSDQSVPNKCGWSPFAGRRFSWKVAHTWVNGNHVYNDGIISEEFKGEQVTFDR